MSVDLFFDRVLFKVTDIRYLDAQARNMVSLLSNDLIVLLFFDLSHFVVVEDAVNLQI
jgi:hypothetical protein